MNPETAKAIEGWKKAVTEIHTAVPGSDTCTGPGCIGGKRPDHKPHSKYFCTCGMWYVTERGRAQHFSNVKRYPKELAWWERRGAIEDDLYVDCSTEDGSLVGDLYIVEGKVRVG